MAAEEHFGLQFVHQNQSPLDYRESTYRSPQRLAIVDPSAGEHPKGETYFAETSRTTRTNPDTGRRLKNPRKVITPGAPPGTVAFVDYSKSNNPSQLFIHYARTRSDQEGRGHATAIINELIQRHEDARHINFGKIISPEMDSVREKIETANPNHIYQYKTDWR